jgi:hypothetical protein
MTVKCKRKCTKIVLWLSVSHISLLRILKYFLLLIHISKFISLKKWLAVGPLWNQRTRRLKQVKMFRKQVIVHWSVLLTTSCSHIFNLLLPKFSKCVTFETVYLEREVSQYDSETISNFYKWSVSIEIFRTTGTEEQVRKQVWPPGHCESPTRYQPREERWSVINQAEALQWFMTCSPERCFYPQSIPSASNAHFFSVCK